MSTDVVRDPGAGRPSRKAVRHVRWLLWATHVVAGFALPVWYVLSEVSRYGLEETGSWEFGTTMSKGFIVVLVVGSLPFAMVETWATTWPRFRWVAVPLGLVWSVLATWISFLPVGLRFCCSIDPVTRSEVGMAVTSYVVVVACFLVMAASFHWFWASRSAHN